MINASDLCILSISLCSDALLTSLIIDETKNRYIILHHVHIGSPTTWKGEGVLAGGLGAPIQQRMEKGYLQVDWGSVVAGKGEGVLADGLGAPL